MLSYDILKDKPKVILAFTSLTVTEFENLLTAFEQVNQQETKPIKVERQRAPGGVESPKWLNMPISFYSSCSM